MGILLETFKMGRFWAKLVGIFLLISFALSAVSQLVDMARMPMMLMVFVGILSIVMAVFSNLLPGIYLLRYSSAIKRAEDDADPTEELEIACLYQGRYLKLIGIVYLIILIIAIVGVVFGIGAGLSGVM